MTDNPIEYPPMDIVQQGCKAILEFLKNDFFNTQINNGKTPTKMTDNDISNISDIRSVTDDVWASDDESNFQPKRIVPKMHLKK